MPHDCFHSFEIAHFTCGSLYGQYYVGKFNSFENCVIVDPKLGILNYSVKKYWSNFLYLSSISEFLWLALPDMIAKYRAAIYINQWSPVLPLITIRIATTIRR